MIRESNPISVNTAFGSPCPKSVTKCFDCSESLFWSPGQGVHLVHLASFAAGQAARDDDIAIAFAQLLP